MNKQLYVRRDSIRRAGITLIEVMFSMGVAFIGLLGVAMIIPLAADQLGRATRADVGGSFGVAMLDDLQVRKFHSPRNWLAWNPNRGTFQPVMDFSAFIPGDSFCLDPNLLMRLDPSHPNWLSFQSFPAGVANTDPAMLRVTIRGMPGLTDPNTNDNIEEYSVSAASEPINRAMLEALVMQTDDLIFSRPADETLPPLQEFSAVNSPADRRQYNGRFSWLVTFSPFFDMRDAVAGQIPYRGAYPQQRLYTMSLVIFDGRVIDPTLPPERVASATLVGAGIGGGDIILESPIEDNIDVRTGDWIMLGLRVPNTAYSGQPQNWPAVFRWYQVAGTDRDVHFDTSNGIYRREVYLDGADWHLPNMGLTAQATIISGVAAVYEKTVRLAFDGP